jgi:hypothetical protein
LCCLFLGCKVNFVNFLEEYKGTPTPLRSITIVSDKLPLQKLLGGVKGLHPHRFALLVLFSLGRKKDYTPRQVKQLALTEETP